MVKYVVISHRLFSQEYGEYISYGLKFTGDNGKEFVVSDLSVRKRCVINFCRLLNDYSIEPDGICDYIEDFLSDEDYYF